MGNRLSWCVLLVLFRRKPDSLPIFLIFVCLIYICKPEFQTSSLVVLHLCPTRPFPSVLSCFCAHAKRKALSAVNFRAFSVPAEIMASSFNLVILCSFRFQLFSSKSDNNSVQNEKKKLLKDSSRVIN